MFIKGDPNLTPLPGNFHQKGICQLVKIRLLRSPYPDVDLEADCVTT